MGNTYRPHLPLPMIVACLCLTALAYLSGCASKADTLRIHTAAATAVDDFAGEVREAVLADRQEAIDAAAADGRAQGLTGDELRAQVQRAADAFDATNAIVAVNGLISAKDAYVRLVLLEASKEEPSWEDAKQLLRNVLDAYRALQAVGVKRLPPVPDAIAKLLTRAPPRPAAAHALAAA